MNLDIILRTHSMGNVHDEKVFGERYVRAPKSEIMLRCTNSLVRSINTVKTVYDADADIRLCVLDDSSDEHSRELLQRILAPCKYETELTLLSQEQCGVQGSALAQFSSGLERGREVVYFVEDDYLHSPLAIAEMLEAYTYFKRQLGGKEVALYPTDHPDRYLPGSQELCRIVYGPRRHWRTVTHSANTCWLSRELLNKHWPLFERLARNFKIDPEISEENTINEIWRTDAVLFSPIPSLALHMQFEMHRDPYMDWKPWWEAAAY